MEREPEKRDWELQETQRQQERAVSDEHRHRLSDDLKRSENLSRSPLSPSQGSPPGDRPTNLGERFQKDVEIIRSIPGLQAEKWQGMTPEQRLESIRQLEAALSKSQERPHYRTYAVEVKDADAKLFNAQENAGQRVDQERHNGAILDLADGWSRPNELHLPLNEQAVRAFEYLIQIRHDSRKPNDPQFPLFSTDPRAVIDVYLHEARHAYQRDAILRPNTHSEVDALTLKLWKDGTRTYRRDMTSPNPSDYFNNPLEADARVYVNLVLSEVYGEDNKTR